MIIKGFVLLLLMVAAPIGTGLLINNVMPIKQRGVGNTYLCGFLCLLALFQLIAVPIVFLDKWGFSLIVILYTCLITILSGGGIIDALHCFRMEKTIWKKKGAYNWNKTLIIQWSIVGILILFQLFMAVFTSSFDGDDAYYVVNSLITQETDTLYRILPYTGLSTSLDMRHAMAVFPIWIAYIARMTGIHATILSHTILPLFLISITYGIYYQIGKKLCMEKKEMLPVYMILVCGLHLFGNTSIYTNATFLIMRNWQGKSMLANVVIPAVFLVLLWIFEEEGGERKGKKILWFLLFILNIVAAMMSTASVFLNCLLIGVMALVLTLQKKEIKILIKLIMCCIPCIVYALIYVVM